MKFDKKKTHQPGYSFPTPKFPFFCSHSILVFLLALSLLFLVPFDGYFSSFLFQDCYSSVSDIGVPCIDLLGSFGNFKRKYWREQSGVVQGGGSGVIRRTRELL
ncbi:hypothetical protein BT93_G0164 [Corymbia citriodora subsp. variegata]|nr:hypothetical protein BT93_G0164 [Corymbia citriodora subsp. variegata]